MQHEQVVTGACTTPTSRPTADEGSRAAGSFDYLRHPVRLTSQEKSTAVTRVRWLEQKLFDGDGHVRRQVSREEALHQRHSGDRCRRSELWVDADPASTRQAKQCAIMRADVEYTGASW